MVSSHAMPQAELPDKARVRRLLEELFPSRFPQRFTVKSEGSFVFLRASEIVWVEAQGDYVKFHAGPRTCLVRMTMRSLEAILDPARFLRIHRSRFVNLDAVDRITLSAERGNEVLLLDGARLGISDGCWTRVKQLYEQAWGRDEPPCRASWPKPPLEVGRGAESE